MTRTRTATVTTMLTVLTVAVLLVSSGCDKLGDDFRTAAGPSMQSGMTSLLTGVVDGAFAVFEPGTTEDGETTGNTGG